MIIFSKDKGLMVVEPISAAWLTAPYDVSGVSYVNLMVKTISEKEYNLGTYEEYKGYDALAYLSNAFYNQERIYGLPDFDDSDLEEEGSDGKEI